MLGTINIPNTKYFLNKKTLRSLLIVPLLLSSSAVFATNGYLLHGYGANKGLGGAGIANPQDALAGATNPAGSVWVGDRFDISGEIFHPNRGYELSKTNTSDGALLGQPVQNTNAGDAFGALGHTYSMKSSRNPLETEGIGFIIPSMGIVKQLPYGNAIGLAIYGAGMGSEYDRDDTPNAVIQTNAGPYDTGTNGTFLDGSTGVDLLLIMGNLHFASKVTDNLSVGVGLVGAAQSFRAKGLQLFTLIAQGKIEDKAREWAFGLGWNAGFQWQVTDKFSVAGSYYSRIELKFDKYTGLLAEQGDFSLAPISNIGMTYKFNRTDSLSFDIQHIAWSKIPSVGNPLSYLEKTPTETDPFPLHLIGDEDGPGFGFQDSLVYKIGYQFKLKSLPKTTWRVGYSYQDQIIPEDGTLFPIVAPATITEHYTAGITHDYNENIELNMNFLYAPLERVRGEGVAGGVDIYLEEYGLEFGLGYKY